MDKCAQPLARAPSSSPSCSHTLRAHARSSAPSVVLLLSHRPPFSTARQLTPSILHNSQKYIKEQEGTKSDKPVFFVFHGGSGSSREDIRYAIEAGVIKMNIDTDTQVGRQRSAVASAPAHSQAVPRATRTACSATAASDTQCESRATCRRASLTSVLHVHPRLHRAWPQWSYWDGIRSYEAEFHPYLQGQIGNPEGATKPNKKYYDPRMPLRRGEEFTAARLGTAMEDLNSVNSCP
jgi:fructose/tagatose bisphosphate aldolase